MKPSDFYKETDDVMWKVEKAIEAMHNDDSIGNVNLLEHMEGVHKIAHELVGVNIAIDDFNSDMNYDDIGGKVELAYEPMNEMWKHLHEAMQALIDVFEDTLDLE